MHNSAFSQKSAVIFVHDYVTCYHCYAYLQVKVELTIRPLNTQLFAALLTLQYNSQQNCHLFIFFDNCCSRSVQDSSFPSTYSPSCPIVAIVKVPQRFLNKRAIPSSLRNCHILIQNTRTPLTLNLKGYIQFHT